MNKIKAFLIELFFAVLFGAWFAAMFYYGLVTSPLYGD